MTEILFSALAAFVATLIGSFSGGGSSLILLPLLLFMFESKSYQELFTVAKVAATTMTWVSASIHRTRTAVDTKLLIIMTSTGLLGTALGTYFLQFQQYEGLFKVLLALTLMLTAAVLMKSKSLGLESKRHHSTPHLYLKAAIACFLINILNGLFGGTGILITILAVLLLGMNFIEAISLTILSYILINTLQTGYLLSTVPISTNQAIGAVTGALLGAFMGTHLQYLKGNATVRRASIFMMILMSIGLISKYAIGEFGLF